MCNRLPEIMKNGDAGIFPVYYSLKKTRIIENNNNMNIVFILLKLLVQ